MSENECSSILTIPDITGVRQIMAKHYSFIERSWLLFIVLPVNY
ncbi:hypothetical protein ABK905_10415 [Acerihabitans sp. KWT182]|uniref:Uncharacterized protein n=1 Tax=Acerihabitans sp. KWT182 TaxID=3157919 RepID=A0AAU7QDZ4_9GAMM